jgi:hypothetical protein
MAEAEKQTPPENKPAEEAEDSLDSLDSPAEENPAPAASGASKDAKPGAAAGATPAAAPGADGPADHIKSTFNIYFIIFIVLVLGAIGIIFYAVSSSKKANKTTETKAPSLTSQQLAALKGNTTLVGDAKTTLDVQSNSVFEAQVLVRNDLNVAGALKVGGSLSLPSLTVSNSGNFGTLQVGSTFGVNGNATVQGTLTVQKTLSVTGGASFGSLNVATLTVTSLQLNGDLGVGRHIVTNGSQISHSPGTALGSGGTVSVSGTDIAGTITVNTGGAPGAGKFVSINFAKPYGLVPRVIISPVGASAGTVTYYVDRTTSGFSVSCATPPPAGSTFSFDYFVID